MRLNDKVRVLIADDHPLVLGALRQAVVGAVAGAEIHEAADFESLAAALEAEARHGSRSARSLDARRSRVLRTVVPARGASRPARDRGLRQRGPRGDAPLPRIRRARPIVPKSLDVDSMRDGDPHGARRRPVDAAGPRHPDDVEPRGERAGASALLADAAAGAGADDALAGTAQQADRIRTQRSPRRPSRRMSPRSCKSSASRAAPRRSFWPPRSSACRNSRSRCNARFISPEMRRAARWDLGSSLPLG